jgi:CelD/BcsL family acetyltransferase involved in cellulose biosynthesis
LRGDQHTPLTAVAPTAKAVFFGASYHADYATLLARPADLPAVAEAVADALVEALGASGEAHDPDHPAPWDVVDLRRFRCGDPAADALAEALGARTGRGWTVVREREEVCPVVTFEPGADFEALLGTLDKKERHEVRRKLRRAESAGEVSLVRSADPVADLDAFVDLHQKRWGAEGLFPATAGGDQSRTFFRRLFELLGRDGTFQLHFLTVDGRRIAAGVWFEDADAWYLYNAGVDPEARELSPGVLMSATAIRAAIAAGRRRFDYLRGDEPYKYEWGALDEPIQRLLVVRTVG